MKKSYLLILFLSINFCTGKSDSAVEPAVDTRSITCEDGISEELELCRSPSDVNHWTHWEGEESAIEILTCMRLQDPLLEDYQSYQKNSEDERDLYLFTTTGSWDADNQDVGGEILNIIESAYNYCGSLASEETLEIPTGSSEQTSLTKRDISFEILEQHPANPCLNDVLDRFVEVFGIYVISSSEVPDEYILHTANVLAQFIDNDEDGYPDDENVLDFLQSENFVTPVWTEELREKVFAKGCDNLSFAASMYYGNDEWAIGGIENTGTWDTNLEEVWHIVSEGWYASYPEYFGSRDSKLLQAMDKARGGKFLKIPEEYPSEAWYAYYDDTCDYYCQAAEYFYWVLMSNIDALDPGITSKCQDSSNEWSICNKKELENTDTLAFELFNKSGFNLPTVLPDGSYGGE